MIRKAIIFHELMPKEQLIEEKLSESLSISRTPLRTALRRLIDEGLVETKGKNTFVSDLAPEDPINIRKVRLPLELTVIEELQDKVTPTLLAQLEDTLIHQEKLQMQSADDYSEYILQDSRFHVTLARATENRFLFDLVYRINTHSSRCLILSPTLRASKTAAVEEHRAIILGLAEHNFDRARAAMAEHIMGVEQRMSRVWEPGDFASASEVV